MLRSLVGSEMCIRDSKIFYQGRFLLCFVRTFFNNSSYEMLNSSMRSLAMDQYGNKPTAWTRQANSRLRIMMMASKRRKATMCRNVATQCVSRSVWNCRQDLLSILYRITSLHEPLQSRDKAVDLSTHNSLRHNGPIYSEQLSRHDSPGRESRTVVSKRTEPLAQSLDKQAADFAPYLAQQTFCHFWS